MTSILRNLLTSKKPRSNRVAKRGANRLSALESLESREMMAVTNLWFSGNLLVVKTDNAASNVEVRTGGAGVQIKDVGMNKTWSYATSQVGKVEFQGGAGNDRFVNYIANLPIKAFGFGGNDYLEGYNGADYFDGGAGNDTCVGYGGDDIMFGGIGNDVLRGMDGNDQMVGQDGNDQTNGGAGNDKAWGGAGDDVLIDIDGYTGDYLQGDAGRDTFWIDQNGSLKDAVYGALAEDKVQNVAGFSNGADRTLNGDRIADPLQKPGAVYAQFSNKPLFSAAGPRGTDIRQGALGDCYAMAGLSAIALDNPHVIRQNVVDFNDGTFGVRLGNKFYRVDNDLPAASSTSTTPAYANLGAEGSMWVAVVEKAFAHYRTGANSYASIEGGWSVEINRAFGSILAGEKSIQNYGNATNLANDIFARWNTYQAVTIGFLSLKPGQVAAPIVTNHMYTVWSVIRNSVGAVTSIVLRNPWGVDGGGNNDGSNDGFVMVTPAQLFRYIGAVNWGRV